MSLSSLAARTTKPFRRLFGSGRAGAVVAVDVATTSVKAIRVHRENLRFVLDGFRISRFRDEPSVSELESGCREALDLRLGNEPVAICVSSPDAAIRKVELPSMSSAELRQALPWEARRHIANLPEDAVVDAQVLSSGNGGPMEIVLVALPRDQYERVADIWQRLQTSPEFVDVGQLATMNSFLPSDPSVPSRTVGLLDLGADESSFSIFSSTDLILFRDLSPKVQNLDARLAEELDLDAEQLHTFKLGGKLPGNRNLSPGTVEKALSDLLLELAEDIRSGLVYFENRTGNSLDRVSLTGANGALFDRHGLTDALSSQSGIALDRYNPFQGFRLGPVDEIGLKTASSELCAAVGVASRYFSLT